MSGSRCPLAFCLSVALIAASFCASCHDEAVDRIHLDIAGARDVVLDTARVLRLEAGDSSLIYGIDNLFHVGGRYIVHSRQYVRAFGDADGHFAGNVATEGEGEGRFSDVSNIWREGDTLAIFDSNRMSIMRYLADGEFLGSEAPFGSGQILPGEHPRKYFRDAGRDVVLTLNGSTGGSTPSNPLISVYDRSHRHIRAMEQRQVQESNYLMDGTFYDRSHGQLLLWLPFRDTIFCADRENLRPLYVLDFGKNSFPREFQALASMNQRARVFNSGRVPPYASLIRYVQTDGDMMYFSFLTSDGQTYLAAYDRANGLSGLCKIHDPSGRYRPRTFFLLDGDSLRVELTDTREIESNPAIYSIPRNLLQ